MNAESVYMASQLQTEIARCRVHAHTPGFTRVGAVRAMQSLAERPHPNPDHEQPYHSSSSSNLLPHHEQAQPLHFYLGKATRMVL